MVVGHSSHHAKGFVKKPPHQPVSQNETALNAVSSKKLHMVDTMLAFVLEFKKQGGFMISLNKQFSKLLCVACSIGMLYSGSSLAESNQKRHNKFKCPEAQLSKEQRMSIRELRKSFKAQKKGLPKDERKAMKEQFRQNVLTSVLTSDEQRVSWTTCREAHRAQRGEHRKNRKENYKAGNK